MKLSQFLTGGSGPNMIPSSGLRGCPPVATLCDVLVPFVAGRISRSRCWTRLKLEREVFRAFPYVLQTGHVVLRRASKGELKFSYFFSGSPILSQL